MLLEQAAEGRAMSNSGSDRTRGAYDETILANPDIVAGTRVNLHAERAQIEKRDVRGQLAIITRRTVMVRKTIEVDLMHEELDVRYVPGDGTEMVGVEPKSFSIFLHAEEVDVVRRVRVVEEVVISKKRVVEEKRIDVALRHERLDVLDAKAR